MKNAIFAILLAAFTSLLVVACTDAQKCKYAKFTYDEFVKSGRGGTAEKAAAKKAYDKAKAECAAKGINI